MLGKSKSTLVLALATALPCAASAATFTGEFWDASAPILSLSQADAIIADRMADNTFTTDLIDFPIGADVVALSATDLSGFLGIHGDTLANNGAFGLKESVFRFTGLLDLSEGEQLFSVGSDDGFRLTIDGTVVSERDELRSFATTDVTTDAGAGQVAFELIYFENDGATGVEFRIDGALAQSGDPTPTMAPVPLPAGLPLLLGALGMIGVMRRKA